MKLYSVMLVVLFSLVAGTALAQPGPGASDKEVPPLDADRPDQTEASTVVPKGTVQVEMGWSRNYNDDNGVETTSDASSSTLVRIGVHDRFELRLGFGGYIFEEVEIGGVKMKDAGAGDIEVGTKVAICEEDGMRPETAILASLSLPTGAVTSNRPDPSARISCSHTVNDRVSFGYNLGFAFESEEDGGGTRHTLSSLEYTAVLGADVTERVGAYIELFGDAGMSRQGGPRNAVDAGVTYLLEENLRLDFAVGLGLSEDADDWFATVGFVYRWPN